MNFVYDSLFLRPSQPDASDGTQSHEADLIFRVWDIGSFNTPRTVVIQMDYFPLVYVYVCLRMYVFMYICIIYVFFNASAPCLFFTCVDERFCVERPSMWGHFSPFVLIIILALPLEL